MVNTTNNDQRARYTGYASVIEPKYLEIPGYASGSLGEFLELGQQGDSVIRVGWLAKE